MSSPVGGVAVQPRTTITLVVIAGPKDQGTGASAEFDMIRLRRIHVIQPDGSLQKEGGGWLPAAL
jgi:hypothetical protein